MRRKAFLLFSAMWLFSIPAFTQEFRASISGQVADPSGAPIASAKIMVTSVERNTVSSTLSSAKGIYLVQFLLPGQYTLAVDSPGFKSYLHRGIALEASDRVNIDVRLEIGAHSEQVTITGEAPLLETETATRASTVENRVLENIPTTGRNLFALPYNMPGDVNS